MSFLYRNYIFLNWQKKRKLTAVRPNQFIQAVIHKQGKRPARQSQRSPRFQGRLSALHHPSGCLWAARPSQPYTAPSYSLPADFLSESIPAGTGTESEGRRKGVAAFSEWAWPAAAQAERGLRQRRQETRFRGQAWRWQLQQLNAESSSGSSWLPMLLPPLALPSSSLCFGPFNIFTTRPWH